VQASLSPTEQRALQHLLAEVQILLNDGHEVAALASLQEAEDLAPEDADVLCLRGEVDLRAGDTARAATRLLAALERAPHHADAHHLLARVLEETGDRNGMIEHDLEVLRLDEANDRRTRRGTEDELAFIETQAREVLDSLPEDLRARMQDVPVALEPRPNQGLVADGFDPRALGLFEGIDDQGQRSVGDMMGERGDLLRPTRIVLFYANLLATCASGEELAKEVVVTVLHEIGHFFGLDEDGVAALGLE
jgi:predicted Zn-dependent protease with MMP-like domain